MRQFYIIGGVVLLVLIFVALYFFSPRFSGNVILSVDEFSEMSKVEIKNLEFSPMEIVVNVGDTVEWTNSDSAEHMITSSVFDSGVLKKGEKYSYTFNEVGEYEYSCVYYQSMIGKVVVV